MKIKKICKQCGKEFEVLDNWEGKRRRTCSIKCSRNTRIKKGQQLSPKTMFKEGQIPWNKGIERPEIRGKNNPSYGGWGKHTSEAKEKIRKASIEMWKRGDIKKIRAAMIGEKSSNWKGGGIIKICKYCKKEFDTEKHDRNKAQFCCMDCWSNYRFETEKGFYEFYKSNFFKNILLTKLDKKVIKASFLIHKIRRFLNVNK